MLRRIRQFIVVYDKLLFFLLAYNVMNDIHEIQTVLCMYK